MKKLEHVLSGCYSTSWRGKPAELSLSPSLFIRATPEREEEEHEEFDIHRVLSCLAGANIKFRVSFCM